MIPNHPQFIEAIGERLKVRVQFYSTKDSGVVDRICAPLDYGPGFESSDGLNRYWLRDCASDSGTPIIGLMPQQIVDLKVLGEQFDPAEFGVQTGPFSIPRSWGSAT